MRSVFLRRVGWVERSEPHHEHRTTPLVGLAPPYEAAVLLRHSDIMTTNRYYARAQDERSQDPARARLRLDPGLSLEQRIASTRNCAR